MSSATWVESCVQTRWGCQGIESRNADLEALIWSYPACYDGESLANRPNDEPNPEAFGADLRKHERSPAREESNVFPSNFRSNASCFSARPSSFGPKTDGELNDIIAGGTRLMNQEGSSGPSPDQHSTVASQSSQQAGQVQHERESLDISLPVVIRPQEDLLQPDTLPADDRPLLVGGAPNRDSRVPYEASSVQHGWMNSETAAPISAHQQQQLQRQRQRQMQVAATLGSNRGGSDGSFESSTMSGQEATRQTPCADALSVNDGRCFPSTLPPEILDDSYVRMMTIAPEVVGWVIGRNGCNIKDIKQASGCELWIDQRELVLYTAGPSVRQLDNAIKAVRELISRAPVNVNSAGLGDEVWKKMIDCPPHLVGLLIGRGGSTIKRIKEESKANVVINQKMMKVIVSGLPDSVQRGVTMIEDVISFGNSSEPGRSAASAHRLHPSEHSGVPRRGGPSSQGVGNPASERFSGRSKGVSPMPGGGRLPSPAPRYAGGLRHTGGGGGGRIMSPYNGLQGESNWGGGGGGVVPSAHFAQPKERRGSNRMTGQGRGQYRQSAAVGSNGASAGRHHKANTWPGNHGQRAEMKPMDGKGADITVLAAPPFDLAGGGGGGSSLDRHGPRHPAARNQQAPRLVSGHQQLTAGSAIRGGGGGGTVRSSISGGAHLDVPRSLEIEDQRALASFVGRNGGGSPPPVDHTCIEVAFDGSGIPRQGLGQPGRLRERILGSPIGKPDSLADFLGEMGLAKYLRVMKENEIDFETMNLMANIDFQDIGIPKGPRVKLLYAVRTNRYPPKSGDVSAMKSFLVSLGLERHCAVFEEQEVDMTAIDLMEEADFADLGVAKGPRLKVLNVVSNLGKRGNHRYPMPQPQPLVSAEGGPLMAVDWLPGGHAQGKDFSALIAESERSSSSPSMKSTSTNGDMRSLSPANHSLDAALEAFVATGSPQAHGSLLRPVLVEAD